MLFQLFCLSSLSGQPAKTGAEPVSGINFVGSSIVIIIFRSVRTPLQEVREAAQLSMNLS